MCSQGNGTRADLIANSIYIRKINENSYLVIKCLFLQCVRIKNGYMLMVDNFSSKERVSIRFRLAVELVVLIGKMFPCRGKLCRIEAGLTRKKGKVAIGRVRYLLNIVLYT